MNSVKCSSRFSTRIHTTLSTVQEICKSKWAEYPAKFANFQTWFLSTVVSAIQGWGYPRTFLFDLPGSGPVAMPLTTNATAHPQTHVFHSCPAKIALVFEMSKWVEASKLLALMYTPLQWLMRFHNGWFCNNSCKTLLHYHSFPLLVPRGACWTDIGSRVLSLNNTPYLNADLPSLQQRSQSHRGIWTLFDI